MSYLRFAAMIVTSTVIMFGLMYLNTFLPTHIFFSETRAYMALLMGATMAIVMLAFMLGMYRNTRLNAAIFAGAIAVFSGSLWLVRSQVTVGDTSFMRAMIPHHSIAIMTSGRARIEDARVRKLADEIIYAQDKEIAEMRYLIREIGRGGIVQPAEVAQPAELVSVSEALASPKIDTMDAGFLRNADIAALFPDGAACTFSYTTESPPALAVANLDGAQVALAKLNGKLVRLDPLAGQAGSFGAEGLVVEITDPAGNAVSASGEAEPAIMRLRLEAGLNAGYEGYYHCAG